MLKNASLFIYTYISKLLLHIINQKSVGKVGQHLLIHTTISCTHLFFNCQITSSPEYTSLLCLCELCYLRCMDKSHSPSLWSGSDELSWGKMDHSLLLTAFSSFFCLLPSGLALSVPVDAASVAFLIWTCLWHSPCCVFSERSRERERKKERKAFLIWFFLPVSFFT